MPKFKDTILEKAYPTEVQPQKNVYGTQDDHDSVIGSFTSQFGMVIVGKS